MVSQLGPGFTSYCIAVSTTDDATGSYARYEFDFGSNIPDYPKLGVWPDAYYWTSNTFQMERISSAMAQPVDDEERG